MFYNNITSYIIFREIGQLNILIKSGKIILISRPDL